MLIDRCVSLSRPYQYQLRSQGPLMLQKLDSKKKKKLSKISERSLFS